YAVGHNVSAETPRTVGPVRELRTSWIPRAEVKRVSTHSEPGVTVAMEALAELTPAAVGDHLDRLPRAYGEWIAKQRAISVDRERRRETQKALMDNADFARGRIAAGIELLKRDPQVLEAFRLANRAMAMAALKRGQKHGEQRPPEWRL